MPGQPVEIACDESGSEGENLIQGTHRIFAHGSIDLSMSEANAVLQEVKIHLGVGGVELKARRLLEPSNIDRVVPLLAPGGVLHLHAHVYLLDKLYFAVGKIVDLLVEEEAYDRGIRLHDDGSARAMASTLFMKGRRALGGANWTRLLEAFVSLVRRRQRSGIKATLDDFYHIVDDVRLRSHDKHVEAILQLIWASRRQAEQYVGPDGPLSDRRNLEPLLAAIPMTTAFWSEKHARAVRIVHDQQTLLTPEIVGPMIEVMNNPHPDFPYLIPIVGVDQVDSRADARIQLADLVSGFGRLAGEHALAGTLTPTITSAIRPMLDANAVWGDDLSWAALAGQR
nr:DUF3800 domain-containing protein [Cellulomonas sp. APG4]